jgi:hypothetical protein
MVTDKRFFTTQLTILLLATIGFIFGWYRLFWPGLSILVIAFVMFVVLAHHDTPKLTGPERRLAWTRIRAQGFSRYLVRQLKLPLYYLAPIVVIDLLTYLFTGRALWNQEFVHSISFLVIAGILIVTLVRWYREERHFEKADSE